MCAASFSFFPTRFDILLVIFLVSLLIVSLLIAVTAAPLDGYYTYARPMMDHEVEYVVADFHNHPIGTGAAYGAMMNATLLEDGSIDVDFAPNPQYIHFQNMPHFEYSRNIKVGQTFVAMCVDYENRLEESKRRLDAAKQEFEELKQTFEELRQGRDAAKQRLEESRLDAAKQEFEELNQKSEESRLDAAKQRLEFAKQRLEESKQRPDNTYVDMLKYTGVKSLEKNPAYEFPSDHFKDWYLGYVERLNGTSTLEFFHFGALLSSHMPCDYPNVIEWSIDVIQTDGREDREWFPRALTRLGDEQ